MENKITENVKSTDIIETICDFIHYKNIEFTPRPFSYELNDDLKQIEYNLINLPHTKQINILRVWVKLYINYIWANRTNLFGLPFAGKFISKVFNRHKKNDVDFKLFKTLSQNYK